MLIAAIVLITLALAFYTTGVWTENRAGRLRRSHVALFLTGLVFDTSGTAVMTVIARSGTVQTTVLNQIMSVTGLLALILMAVHAVWAVVVLIRAREHELAIFHRFSVAVWVVWLIPYVTGMLGSMIG
ncbi:HsmA family protein [Brachybacterium timonense]|uniref:HsmA family protein n=1 Tax=Brachybacterium timonense TaxID=2050896 RepID=UPI000D0BD4F6|nr:HsmA family protein [Brachybacterium timonense]